jgi:hypothetical protein
MTSIRATSYGLGVGHLRTRGLADMAQLLLQTPIDAEHLHVRWQFAVPPAADGKPQPLGVASSCGSSARTSRSGSASSICRARCSATATARSAGSAAGRPSSTGLLPQIRGIG